MKFFAPPLPQKPGGLAVWFLWFLLFLMAHAEAMPVALLYPNPS